jgi:hypothetical protein
LSSWSGSSTAALRTALASHCRDSLVIFIVAPLSGIGALGFFTWILAD